MGKTTTLEILEGFRARDGGRVEVLGLDPSDRKDARILRERIGLVLQDIAVEPYLIANAGRDGWCCEKAAWRSARSAARSFGPLPARDRDGTQGAQVLYEGRGC